MSQRNWLRWHWLRWSWQRWIWASGLLCILLAGCAGTSEQPQAPTAQRQMLVALTSWTARGKVALRNASTQESANLVWRQNAANSHLSLSGPLGAGAIQVFSDGQQLTIQRGTETRTVDISTPEAVSRNTGWELPLQALPHWLKGVPDPSEEPQRVTLDPVTGRLTHLRQFDWEVHYEQFRTVQLHTRDAIKLPARLVLTKDDTRATVLIRDWSMETE